MPNEFEPNLEPPDQWSIEDALKKDALVQAIFNYIKLHFYPAEDVQDCLNLSTVEIYERICGLYPDPPFDAGYLAQWLQGNGYLFRDMGDLKFVWLIKAA